MKKKSKSSRSVPAVAKTNPDDRFSRLREFITVISSGSAKTQAKIERIVLEKIVSGLAHG